VHSLSFLLGYPLCTAGEAASKGAQIILLQELFATTYFPVEQTDNFRLAVSLDDDRSYLSKLRILAKELEVVLPLSFYERAKYGNLSASIPHTWS
jgi:N-carbamoylputrescine amidase